MKRFLAMTAVLFLLLRPACDAWGAAHGHADAGASAAAAAVVDGHGTDSDSTEFCCAKVQESNLILPVAVTLAGSASEGWSTAPAVGIRMGRAHQREARVGHLPDTPPLPSSYYARSARILR